MPQKLRKKYIIHLENEVNSLLKSELSRFHYPIKLIYQVDERIPGGIEENPHYKVIFIIPKRYLKKAYMRNLAKRRLREAFRMNQNLLDQFRERGKTVYLAFIYVSAEVVSFKQLESGVVKLLTDLK
ncbi:hypothetical protein GYA27_02435 [candidate division WWE3 bacterium]|uniref:Uncharacterized protein n=1 Tax=candidate division WWE3 bacterium TaxID=2053526 RepID=A0A7X9DKD7_UNCKA|nr:hypothetical protein [candidate division WWE3 bacterium]